MSTVPKLTIEMPGVSTPEQHHEEVAKKVTESLEQAGVKDHQVIPVTPETQVVITDKNYEIHAPEPAPTPVKQDPELTGLRATLHDTWENLKQFKWARFRATPAKKFNEAKLEAVVQKAEQAASPK